MQQKELGPTTTWSAMLCSSTWEACPFLSGDREGVEGEGGYLGGGGGNGKRGGEKL